MTLRLRPITLTEAKRYVNEHHRHNEAPLSWSFGVAAETEDGELVGVAMAGRPAARKLQQADPRLLEITRVCTTGHRNACSLLYGAICRAARALGYTSVITYTQEGESGASLRAAGFTAEADLPPARPWTQPSRPRYEANLFGERRRPRGAKTRWRKTVAPPQKNASRSPSTASASKQPEEATDILWRTRQPFYYAYHATDHNVNLLLPPSGALA